MRSTAALTLPSSLMSLRITKIMVGMAQKSPQIHRMPAPICWSANAGRVTPGTWLYTEYQDVLLRNPIAIASTHIWQLVASSATAWPTDDILIRNGGDEMNCSQNSTPVMKKLPCTSQTWTAQFR